MIENNFFVFVGSEETDHSLVNDLTHVIWAYGQKHGQFK